MHPPQDRIVVFHEAAGAFAHPRLKFDDPLFDPGTREFQIGLFEAPFLFAVVDLFVAAIWTAGAEWGDNDLVRGFGLPDHVAPAKMLHLLFWFAAGSLSRK